MKKYPRRNTCPRTFRRNTCPRTREAYSKVHMIGIGGIGMSGLAFILSEMGCRVSGSDIAENTIIKRLRRKGAVINIGHNGSYIKDQNLVVYSSSIPISNPEMVEAKKKKLPIISRTELLKMVMGRYKRIVGITGTHGKTTITAMASLLLEEGSFDPTILIGGECPHFDGNAKLGKGQTLVVEVDESDGRFTILKPTHIIISNLEQEHPEHYRDEGHLVDTFRKFLSEQSRRSLFFYMAENQNLRKLASAYPGRRFNFGLSKEADVYADNIKLETFKVGFDCFYRRKKLGNFIINIPGVHNVLNALAVISLGLELGLDVNTIKRALFRYKGVKRRFEVIGDVNGVKIIEDYAHHPTEIKATISTACSLKPKRLITIFQPHRYTRTKLFYEEFSASFTGSDEVILTEIYPASEQEIEGVRTKNIYDIMVKDNSIPVKLMKKDGIPAYLSKKIKRGDLVLILGAGDIGKISNQILST